MEPLIALTIISLSVLAGLVGSLLGLGGGLIVVPALTLGLGFSMQEAIGASLIGVIASSTGAAARYVREGYANIKLGMLLETTTTVGAILGALTAVYLDQMILFILFSFVLVFAAHRMMMRKETVHDPDEPGGDVGEIDLSCSYYDPRTNKEVAYGVRGIKVGLFASLAAGGLSGLLGVGGGVIKVPVMNAYMCVPMKAATATSNFMIGVTALSGALIYFRYDLIQPVLAALVGIGVLMGAMAGSRIIERIDSITLRKGFGIFLLFVAIMMALRALGLIEVA
ncbi:MAG: sulfite exporter TauE/SafE family protein [Methanomassiliicoccales archaeon]|nr:MAG: sulfite exporter TauE/SafE family protein [Methanomassiliicoccales archaeon]